MMKKIIVITLILILTLSIIGCGKSSAIPSLNEIKSDRYTEEDIEISLWRVKRDELIVAWGEPDRTIQHENEDIWVLDERHALVISYNLIGNVDDVDIED